MSELVFRVSGLIVWASELILRVSGRAGNRTIWEKTTHEYLILRLRLCRRPPPETSVVGCFNAGFATPWGLLGLCRVVLVPSLRVQKPKQRFTHDFVDFRQGFCYFQHKFGDFVVVFVISTTDFVWVFADFKNRPSQITVVS